MTEKNNGAHEQYWREHIALILKLLAIWFAVSFGCGILLADVLNQISLFGFKLGFWFAQQGSIFVFVALIFIYARKMNKLDKKFDFHED